MDKEEFKNWLKNIQDDQLLGLFIRTTDKWALDLLLENITDEQLRFIINISDLQLIKLVKTLDDNMLFRVVGNITGSQIRMLSGFLNGKNLRKLVRNMTDEQLYAFYGAWYITLDDFVMWLCKLSEEDIGGVEPVMKKDEEVAKAQLNPFVIQPININIETDGLSSEDVADVCRVLNKWSEQFKKDTPEEQK